MDIEILPNDLDRSNWKSEKKEERKILNQTDNS